MKKYIFFLVQGIFLWQFSVSAQFTGTREAMAKSISVTPVTSPELSSLMKTAFAKLPVIAAEVTKVTGIPSFSLGDFDFINLYKSEKKGETEFAYSAPFIRATSRDKYAFALFQEIGLPGRPMLIRSLADRSLLVYYDLLNGKTAEIMQYKDSYTVNSKSVEFNENNNALKTTGGGPCGQAVMDCITDAYTRRGWLSVWVTIQSIFVPATGVGIALGCVAANCK